MIEQVDTGLKGRIRIYTKDNPEQIWYEANNTIVLSVKGLFARLMANSGEPANGIWGLALGSGDPAWGDNPSDATSVQWNLVHEIKRKQRTAIRFLDAANNPTSNFTNVIEVQTLFNATDDNITDPVREMGLIGGGNQTTNMLTSQNFWDPQAITKDPSTITLINYKTLPTFNMPGGLDLVFAWVLSM
jgi:hypothetical protein